MLTCNRSSAASSHSSRPSSRSSYPFSTGVVSHAGSELTPASSRAPSECGTTDEHGIDTSQPRRRTSQLRILAAAAAQPSDAPEIDEQSPDEDERMAQSVIRSNLNRKCLFNSATTYSFFVLLGARENTTAGAYRMKVSFHSLMTTSPRYRFE